MGGGGSSSSSSSSSLLAPVNHDHNDGYILKMKAKMMNDQNSKRKRNKDSVDNNMSTGHVSKKTKWASPLKATTMDNDE